MTETTANAAFPRWFLAGTAAMMVAAILVAGVASLTGRGASRVQGGAIVASVDIWFDEQRDGSVLVRRATDNRTLEVLPADGSGFIRGVARTLFRQRVLGSHERTLPVRLARREDNKLFVLDSVAGVKVEIDGFGPTNVQAFATLLAAGLAPVLAGPATAGKGAE